MGVAKNQTEDSSTFENFWAFVSDISRKERNVLKEALVRKDKEDCANAERLEEEVALYKSLREKSNAEKKRFVKGLKNFLDDM